MFRLRLPKELATRFNKNELKCSLKTCDMALAKQRCNLLATAAQQLFSYALTMTELTQAELTAIAQDYFRYLLRAENEQLFKLREIDKCTHDEMLDYADRYQSNLTAFKKTLPKPLVDLKEWLGKHGQPQINAYSDSFDILLEYFGRAKLESARIARAKILKQFSDTAPLDPLYAGIFDDTLLDMQELNDTFAALKGKPTVFNDSNNNTPTKSLFSAVEAFLTYKEKVANWSPKTKAEYTKSFDDFLAFTGKERLLHTLKSSHIELYQAHLLSSNKNASKYKNNTQAPEVKISEKTVVKKMTPIKSFIDWAAAEDLIPKAIGKNVKLKVSATSDKEPFTQKDLALLFASTLFDNTKQWGNHQKDPEYYWLLLVLALTGARLGEIVSLTTADIKQSDEGVWFIDINATGDKTLKTKNSKRKVPIHKFLIDNGFINFYQKRLANGSVHLFNHIHTASDPVNAASKWTNRYINKVGMTDKNLTLHSLRHSFMDACRTAKVVAEHRKQIMGHAGEGMDAVYGKGADISALQASMNIIKYDYMLGFKPKT